MMGVQPSRWFWFGGGQNFAEGALNRTGHPWARRQLGACSFDRVEDETDNLV